MVMVWKMILTVLKNMAQYLVLIRQRFLSVLMTEAKPQVGTLGSGNHFIEVQVIDQLI